MRAMFSLREVVMYGKCRLHLCRSRSHIWLVAYSLLQIAPCFADFQSSDSTNLQNCRRLLSEIAFGDPNLVSTTGASSFDYLSDIWDVVRYADFQQLGSDVDAISRKLDDLVDYSYQNNVQLQNIAANTEAAAQTITHISDRIEQGITVNITNDFIVAMTNAFAAIPRCYCVATNFVGSSIDLSIVTNLATYFLGNTDVASWGNFDGFPLYTSLYRLFALLYGDDSIFDMNDFKYLWAQSPLGFLLYLYQSALLPSDAGGTGFDSFDYAWDVWTSSGYFSFPIPDYTIFDAYNTLGLGVLTNQAASLISIAHANTNLLTRILDVLNDEEHGLKALAIASANSYASISNALGSSEQADLDHQVSYEMPEWEPTYGRYANSNTNHVEWDDAMGVMTRNIFGNTTNQINDVASSIGAIAASDLSLQFNFSGFELTSAGPIGSWSVLAALTDDATIAEAKNLFRAMSSFMFYVLDLCIVVLGCRRIQRALIGDVGIL